MPEDESLMSAWRTAEAATAASAPEEAAAPEAEAEAPAEPTDAASEGETPAAEAKVKAIVKDVAAAKDEIEQLRELTKRLGYKMEDGRVTVGERAKLREEKRDSKLRIQSLESQLDLKINNAKESLKSYVAAKETWEAGDIDGFAKTLGYEDWNGLQTDVIHRFADPSYKKIQELQRKQRERDERDANDAETAQKVAANRERMEAVATYKRGLSQEMTNSENPLVKAMATDSFFQDAIYQLQEAHYDRSTDTTITLEEAIEMVPRGMTRSLKDEMRGLFDKLQAAFGASPPDPAKAPPAKRAKTGTLPREAEAPHVGKTGGSGFMDAKDREYWANQLKSSGE